MSADFVGTDSIHAVIIIPARFQSNRFPGKPLAIIAGREMILRVWGRCCLAVPACDIYVATDDERIRACCAAAGVQTIMTSSDCLTGTDRVYEASLQIKADVYLNVQGDEPLLDPHDILAVIDAAKKNPGVILNAMAPIREEADFRSNTVPKVVVRPDGRLLYMSRAPIPTNKQHDFVSAMKQVCIYGFTAEALAQFSACRKKTPLEEIEDIEILRFLELGFDVQMITVSESAIAVDVPSDVFRVESALRNTKATVDNDDG
jgi:3-deoxy-manno-octulosonate cytidylyltransferase (CMP-KDO synthetase)